MKTPAINTSVEAPEWSSVVKMTEGHDQHVHSVGIYNNGVEVARSYAVIDHTPDFIDALVKQANTSTVLVDALKTARAAVYEFTRSALIDAGNSRPGSGLLAHNNPVILEIDAALELADPNCDELVCAKKCRAQLQS